MKAKKYDVLVAGAGPVGLTTALALRHRGLSPLVVEEKPRGATHSYALALHPRVLHLFAEIGVLQPIIDRALLVRRVSLYAGDARIATQTVAAGDDAHPYVAVIGQDVLEAILVEALEARGVEVRWNHRLARFEQDAEQVFATVAELEERIFGYAAARFDWDVKDEYPVQAAFLVGADGHRSLVRRQLEIGFPEVGPAEHFAVFEFETTKEIEHEMAIVLHDEGLGVLWPLPEGRARWSYRVDPERCPQANREKDHEPVQLVGSGAFPALDPAFLEHLLKTRAPWFPPAIGHLYWRMLVRFERRLAERFGTGRIWLAGDAAHITAPGGIQGMNIGLVEAVDLAGAMLGDLESGRVDKVLGYGERARSVWTQLFALTEAVEAEASAPAAIAAHRQAIVLSLPASGNDLTDLAGRLGLRVPIAAGG